MSEQTIDARTPTASAASAGSFPRPHGRDARRRLRPLRAAGRWWLGAAAVLAVGAIVVVWARTRPGYDPYGWLVWGHLTLRGALDTNGAPSWKPLPFLFTVPYALFGHLALWLWMVTAVAVSLSGAVFAWRIAFRLTGAGAGAARRFAAPAAGAVAAICLLGIADYTHFILSAQSDTMIVAVCLGAVDCHLNGRHRWAYVLWWLGALGRPEVWPFLALCSLWMWRELPRTRRLLGAGALLVAALWFGIPALTAKSFFIAGDNALHSPRELHGNKVTGTLQRFIALEAAPVWAAALVGVAIAALRRRIEILAVAAGVVVYVVVEVAFALHGWPAVPRYLFEAAGGVAVLAGVGVGLVILELPPLLARLLRRRPSRSAGAGIAALVVAAFAVLLLPVAQARYRTERLDLRHERARTAEIAKLGTAVKLLGPSRILACAKPVIPTGYQSILAWDMGVTTGILHFHGSTAYAQVNLRPTAGGWRISASHVSATLRGACARMRLTVR